MALVVELAKRSVEKALRYSVPLYDSSYLSLGELLGALVYTANIRLIGRVGGKAPKR